MREYYRVQANINLDAIYENFLHAKQLLKQDTKLMAVIKADAYGHGAVEVAHTIDNLADQSAVWMNLQKSFQTAAILQKVCMEI